MSGCSTKKRRNSLWWIVFLSGFSFTFISAEILFFYLAIPYPATDRSVRLCQYFQSPFWVDIETLLGTDERNFQEEEEITTDLLVPLYVAGTNTLSFFHSVVCINSSTICFNGTIGFPLFILYHCWKFHILQ